MTEVEPAGTPLYRVAPWTLVRTPLLPAASSALAREPRAALADAEVRRALAIGSPTLLAKTERPDADAKEARHTDQSLARYLIRMSTRPTPFGAFAAVSLATWGDETTVRLGRRRTIRSRVDMGWVAATLARWAERAEVRRAARWRADPLVRLAGERYVSPSGAGVSVTPAVTAALDAAASWIDHRTLREAVRAVAAGTDEEHDALLDQLVRVGLLQLDLWPTLTGSSATSGAAALELLGSIDSAKAGPLAELAAALEALDAAPADQTPQRLRAATAIAAAIEPSDQVLQSDLSVDLEAGDLHPAVADECARAVETLLRLAPAPKGSADLARYTERFVARWGSGREEPLTTVFDPVRGLGPLPHTHGAPELEAGLGARRSDTLLRLGLEALRDGRREIVLDYAAIDTLATWSPRQPLAAPLSLDVAVQLLAPSPAAIDRGDFRLVIGPNLGAPVAGRWLGRFADQLDDSAAFYEWLLLAEQRAEPAGEPAEVVYLPANPRSANVVLRPTLTTHEIVVSGRGSAPCQHDLHDLVVGHDGRALYLRSLRDGVRLRPTARHMLNHHGAPAVCQFLDALGNGRHVDFTGFDWGPAESLPVLPRVVAGRTVLAPARWTLTVRGSGAGAPIGSDAVQRELDDSRVRWGLPQRVYLTSGDNRLLLDLGSPSDREQVVRECRNSGGRLRFTEALPDLDDAWLPGPDGRYLAELVVSLVRRPVEAAPPNGHQVHTRQRAIVQQPVLAVTERLRPPGSDWLFAKFYAPPERLTELLTDDLADLIEMAENSGLAKRWFFIRYSDPDPHLRLRWQGDPDVLLRHLLPQVTDFGNQLLATGRISRLAFDTYERELERYGGAAGIEACEGLFHADSVAVRTLLGLAGAQIADVAIASTLAVFDGLGLDDAARDGFYAHAMPSGDRELSRSAGEQYRTRKARLRELVARPPQGIAAALSDLRDGLSRAVVPLRLEADRSGLRLEELWPSLLHMHHNRLVGPFGPPAEALALQLAARVDRGLRVAPAVAGR